MLEVDTIADCLLPGWSPLEKGQAASRRSPPATGCLRHTRSLVNESIYGFGQVSEGKLSAIGTAMMMTTSAHNLPDGHESDAPAPILDV